MNYTNLAADELGVPIYNSENIIEMLYQGQIDLIPLIQADSTDLEITKFNESAKKLGISPVNLYSPMSVSQLEFDNICQSNWSMPDEYKELDIEKWVVQQCPPWDPEATRVNEELVAFKERNMLNLLRWLKYFVDTCRRNNVVWGVGRGSSVASYVLFLIGVHKIDSIKYNLDWQEFLR